MASLLTCCSEVSPQLETRRTALGSIAFFLYAAGSNVVLVPALPPGVAAIASVGVVAAPPPVAVVAVVSPVAAGAVLVAAAPPPAAVVFVGAAPAPAVGVAVSPPQALNSKELMTSRAARNDHFDDFAIVTFLLNASLQCRALGTAFRSSRQRGSDPLGSYRK